MYALHCLLATFAGLLCGNTFIENLIEKKDWITRSGINITSMSNYKLRQVDMLPAEMQTNKQNKTKNNNKKHKQTNKQTSKHKQKKESKTRNETKQKKTKQKQKLKTK